MSPVNQARALLLVLPFGETHFPEHQPYLGFFYTQETTLCQAGTPQKLLGVHEEGKRPLPDLSFPRLQTLPPPSWFCSHGETHSAPEAS